MTRRANGEGWATKGPDGRWRGSIKIAGRVYHRRGATQKEVLAKLRSVRDGTGSAPLPVRATVSDWLTRWLDGRRDRVAEGTLKPRSLEADDRNCRLHLVGLGSRKLGSLTTEDVLTWHSALLRSGLSRSTADQAHRTLHNALGSAVVQGHLKVNPAGAGSWPRTAELVEHRATLSGEQARQLVAAVTSESARLDFGPARVLLQLVEGLRQGEALGLQWGDIDLEAGILTVRRTLSRPSYQHGRFCTDDSHKAGRCPTRQAGPATGTPKSLRGRRRVPLSAMTLAALKEQRRRVLARRLTLGNVWVSSTEWVFPGELGQRPAIRADSRRWAALVKSTLGDQAPTGTHAGRRHAASQWAATGIPVSITMDAFGWTRAGMLDLYASTELTARQAAVQSVWAAWEA